MHSRLTALKSTPESEEQTKLSLSAWRQPLRHDRGNQRLRRGFTLIEMLVTISIVSLLLALLMPGLGAVRSRSREFKCQMNLRSIAFDFRIFADPQLHGNRGNDANDPRLHTGRQFWLETFQESQYGIDEFWSWGQPLVNTQASNLGVMNCPEVRGEVAMRSSTPCSSGAVQPARFVSYTFNLRLFRPERLIQGQWRTVPEPLSERILEQTRVPLAWDVDGIEAERRALSPHYSAPPLEPDRPYGNGHLWLTGLRHGGCVQVAFTSGEVECVEDPLADSSWQWGYTP